MASLKYRCLDIAPKTIERAVAASQKFYHNGGAFVFLDGSGNVTLALTATATLYGYVDSVPTGKGAGTADGVWESSATAGKDKVAVIPVSEGARFIVPADATVTEAMKGNACDLIGVNDGTAQQADVGTHTTDVLIIDGVGTDVAGGSATDAIVKINPANTQADT